MFPLKFWVNALFYDFLLFCDYRVHVTSKWGKHIIWGPPESVFLMHGLLYLAQNKLSFPVEQKLHFHQYILMTLVFHTDHQSVLYLEGL